MGLLYRYSVGGYRYCVGDPFWVWVPKWVPCPIVIDISNNPRKATGIELVKNSDEQ